MTGMPPRLQVIPSHRLSASKLHTACLYWARGDVTYPEQPPSPAAARGTLAHLMANWSLSRARNIRVPDLGLSDEDIETGLRTGATIVKWLHENGYMDRPVLSEFGIVYDALNDRAWAGKTREEGYDPVRRWETSTTIDIATCGESLDIEDFKTGKRENAHGEQLQGQALFLARAMGWTGPVRARFLMATLTQVTPTPWLTFTQDALDVIAGEVYLKLEALPTAAPVAQVTGKRGSLIANPGCWWCDCKRAGACPIFNGTRNPNPQEH